MKRVQDYFISDWEPKLKDEEERALIESLENGQVLNFPKLDFRLTPKEKEILSSSLVKKNRKNISYNLANNQLKGCTTDVETHQIVYQMMKRFASYSKVFAKHLLPFYDGKLEMGRSSFRPVEILGRKAPSYRKDDTLLHIDSFPSSPTNGKRILRFFCNVNPFGSPRVWKLGEPLSKVLERYLSKIRKPVPGLRQVLYRFGITKSYRILYDHYMLSIHNAMKADSYYQKKVDQEIIEFPPHTSWMTFTDQVSHAALSGQYVFEQSFYLDSKNQKDPEKSPLNIMEKINHKNMRK